jgi:hypothetical protein
LDLKKQLHYKKQLDYGQHIGKVVTVEKPSKEGEKKDDNSASSTLAPGIGVTQQLFVTTDFLDAPDKKEEDRKDDGLDNVSIKSPNLWLPRMMNKMRLRPSLKKTPRLEPSLKSWRPQRRRRLVE